MIKKILLVSLLLAAGSLSAEKYALIYGTNYQGDSPISDLELCERDAERMKSQIVATGSFKNENVHVFLGAQVTRKSVEENLVGWLGKQVKEGDQVFFYFAGHGQFFRDESAKNGMRNYIIMFNRPHVSDDELNDWLKQVKTQKAVIILDACFSGGIAKKGASVRGAGNIPIAEGENSAVLQGDDDVFFQNKVVVSSADDNETAIELSAPINHGLFTYYFSDALLKGDLNNDGKVTAYEAFFRARKQTTETAAKVNHKQVPQISGDASGFFFVGVPTPPVKPPTEDKDKPKKEDDKLPDINITLTEEDKEKDPPVTDEEPVNDKNKENGTLVIKTTYRKDVLGAAKPAVYLNETQANYTLQWEKNPHWGDVATMTIAKVPTGVTNVAVKASKYPDQVIKTAIEKNQTTTEVIAASVKGRGSIEGNVWLETFDRPVPGIKVFLKPIRIPKQPVVLSDASGRFVFNELKPGNYTIFIVAGTGGSGANKVFTKPYEHSITVEENGVTKVDVVLRDIFKK